MLKGHRQPGAAPGALTGGSACCGGSEVFTVKQRNTTWTAPSYTVIHPVNEEYDNMNSFELV